MAMAASSSTSASSASNSANPKSNSNSSFDIFINYRGVDTKKTFVSYLYRRLHSHGLKVFLDQEELQQGNYVNSQVEEAIKTASVHVAIISATYAESQWCLNELVLMLESKAPIIPVFYHVKPDALRWWTEGKDGVYAQALQKLEKKAKYDPQTQQRTRWNDSTVQRWRNALCSVADMSGLELEAFNGDEGELLEEVVEIVLMTVKKTSLNVAKYPTGLDEKVNVAKYPSGLDEKVELAKYPSGLDEKVEVAKYPTGLNEKVEEFQNKVFSGGRNAHVTGVFGLGGVGKTTLAKELFNLKSSNYKSPCFLSNVREYVSKGSLTALQSKLLESLTGSYVQIDNKEEGKEKLERHLSTSPILLILDDVDKEDQVHSLLPNQTSLHSNSLILITSRNKDVLTNSGVEESSIYKLDGLSEQHSQELFCCHAFSQQYPLPGFESLTEQFIKACQGLPLALKVLGALLHGQNDMSYWRDQLARLENILPSETEQRLKISYDALNREEKQIFLDISCFLIGHDRDEAILIWDASGWQGGSGFQNLQDKCLVEVEAAVEWGSMYQIPKINMHDDLRDLGRAIAGSLLPLRIWRCTENMIDDLLQQSSVITVRGIRMVLSEYRDEYDDEFDSIEMRRLQLVDTEGFLLERILRRVKFPNLIWLSWKECTYSSLPSWIPVKNLRVLQVSGSTLETLWQQESQLPVCLEVLRVDGCKKLKVIRGLEQATKLQRLHVSGCSELEELPSLEALVSLEVLCAWGCVKLKSIRGFEEATQLRRLDVGGCSGLEALPSMERLVFLEQLRAEGCVKLKRIRGLEQATKLRWLDVRWCSKLEALPSMETLASLEELRAAGCMKLKSIRGLEQATKLRLLDIGGCCELEALSSMETLASLEELWAEGCVKLKSIRGISQCIQLRKLSISWLQLVDTEGFLLERIPRRVKFPNLIWLCWKECLYSSLPSWIPVKNLRVLQVSGSTLETLWQQESQESQLPVCLEVLRVDGCKKLKIIRGLEQATKLQRLHVSGCSELEELPSFEALVSLEVLWAWGCVKLKSIRGFEQATQLRRLDVGGCSELEALPSMERLVSLEQLRAEGCVKLKRIRGLEQATKLRWLDVRWCSELEALPSMETLVSLEELRAAGCMKLKRIRGLEQATKLRLLDIGGCCELEALSSMETLASLEELWAEGCVKLKSIRGISQCIQLRKLSISRCCELEEVEGTWLERFDYEYLNLQWRRQRS